MDNNRELLNVQEKWLETCQFQREYHFYGKQLLLSRPFCFALTEQYIQSSHKIMVIGQEARDWGYYSSSERLERIQKENEKYVDVQLGYSLPSDKIMYNRSPFWNFFRQLKKNGLEPVWNNVDKFHLIEKEGEKKEKTVCLPVELEEVFSCSDGSDNKPLLRSEIEIAKPDMVVFVTGPNYYKTMAIALGIEDKVMISYKPCKTMPCRDITVLADLKIPVLWTYHPAYLNRIKELDKTINRVKDAIYNE